MPPTNERDVYIIPQNFVDTGTVLGGTVKLRNALEAGTLFLCTAVPLFYLPLPLKTRIILVICSSLPLAIFGIVGIGGDSLPQFLQHRFRFLRRRHIVTPTPEGNLEANRQHHLRLINRRKYRIKCYDDVAAVPQGAQILFCARQTATVNWCESRPCMSSSSSLKSKTASFTLRMAAM